MKMAAYCQAQSRLKELEVLVEWQNEQIQSMSATLDRLRRESLR